MLLDSWHTATDAKNMIPILKKMTDDAIFIGTDATEIGESLFRLFTKPYLIKERQVLHWNAIFISINRMAWF
jgi:hypothetical protein